MGRLIHRAAIEADRQLQRWVLTERGAPDPDIDRVVGGSISYTCPCCGHTRGFKPDKDTVCQMPVIRQGASDLCTYSGPWIEARITFPLRAVEQCPIDEAALRERARTTPIPRPSAEAEPRKGFPVSLLAKNNEEEPVIPWAVLLSPAYRTKLQQFLREEGVPFSDHAENR